MSISFGDSYFKYDTAKTNIFSSSTQGTSQFFIGFMWAASTAKMGFRWRIGNGKNIKFWEDNWLGSSSLAIQYCEIDDDDLWLILGDFNFYRSTENRNRPGGNYNDILVFNSIISHLGLIELPIKRRSFT